MSFATDSRKARLPDQWADSLASAARNEEPAWLHSLRTGAAAELIEHGLPGNKDEAWKYTSLRRVEPLRPVTSEFVADKEVHAEQWQPPVAATGAYGFRFLGNGIHRLDGEIPHGVQLATLAEALEGVHGIEPALLQTVLGNVNVAGRSHAFEALNTALLRDGVVIHVAAGVDAGTCSAQWATSGLNPDRLGNFRLLILLEEDARLEFRDEHRGRHLNLLMQASLARGSELRHVRIQNDMQDSVLLTFSDIHQAENSSYSYHGFEIGGGLVRHEMRCTLAGTGAQADLNGAFVLSDERHVDHHLCVDHAAPSCSSGQFFRGVLDGHSRGVFNGKALIRPGADGSSVRQSNANLLLSDAAEMDTKPELEIYADDVEASHGATVGQLDEQSIFYLRSRGIAEPDARRMLTTAFCRAVSSRLPDRSLADQVGEMLDAAMAGLVIGGGVPA